MPYSFIKKLKVKQNLHSMPFWKKWKKEANVCKNKGYVTTTKIMYQIAENYPNFDESSRAGVIDSSSTYQ